MSSRPGSSSVGSSSSYDRPTGSRIKSRDENFIRWVELLDKFKNVQDKVRRSQQASRHSPDPELNHLGLKNSSLPGTIAAATMTDQPGRQNTLLSNAPRGSGLGILGTGSGRTTPGADASGKDGRATPVGAAHKSKSSLSHLGRLGIGGRKFKH